MNKIFNRVRLGVAAITLLCAAGASHASPITFTYTGAGSGSIGNNAFSNTAFIITQTADTDDITNIVGCEGCLLLRAKKTRISLDGIGNFLFTWATTTFYNNGMVGFSRPGGDLYNAFSVGTEYRLDSAIGPAPFVTGAPGLLQWYSPVVDTDGGILRFHTLTTPGTFQASTPTVPVPAAAWLFGSGLIGLAATRRRKRIPH